MRELRIENIEKVKRIRELMLKRGGEVGKDEKIRRGRVTALGQADSESGKLRNACSPLILRNILYLHGRIEYIIQQTAIYRVQSTTSTYVCHAISKNETFKCTLYSVL